MNRPAHRSDPRETGHHWRTPLHHQRRDLPVGAVLPAIPNFILVAATVHFVLGMPMNWLIERRRTGQEPELEAPSEEILMLTQIRDLLGVQRP
jgi:large-conductance mechanosensitive channel